MTLASVKDHAHRIRTGDFSAGSPPTTLQPSSSADSTLSTASTLTPDDLASFQPLQRIAIHPNTYTHPKKLLGHTTERTPETHWLVARCSSTQDLLLRDIRTLADTERHDLSSWNAEQQQQRVEYKPNTGKPEGEVSVALVMLYLYTTRQCHGFRLKNIGPASTGSEGAEYDLTRAVCVGEEDGEGMGDAAEREFWRHVAKADGVGVWSASGTGDVRVRLRTVGG